MHKDIIDALSVITEEEQAILDGQVGINRTLYTEKREMIVDSNKLLAHGKLIEIRPHTRFVHFPKHKHNYVEVIYMCSGSTKHKINDKEVVLKAGELLFLNQNATQEIFPAGEQDIAVNFIIQPEFFDTTFMMLGEENNLLRDFLIGCLCNDSRYTNYLLFRVADVLPIQNLVENMIWTIMNNQTNKRSINQTTMGLLFLQLLNYTDKLNSEGNSFEQDLMFRVLSYIEENYKDATLTELSNLLKYDIYWLSRAIKKQTNETFKDLLKTKRLNQSAYLLSHTKLSVAEIIAAVGYDNTSYFHRIFKERFQMSPKEYRLDNLK
ncbi:AraC family transcriptional regulator [Clostridium sp. Marseille-P299]|uniref:AraC family transcriptional regulator n=1 Tax=Clostridium sp. Marseille-P299 TaxID=1805477 RepID=UPI000831705C|nr:AraC family transcriptional regulator [Clostridium sp. Marseille-P299]